MPSQFLKKLIKLSEKHQFPKPLNGELLYSKNNVCVHLPGLLSNLHHPGFLAVTAKIENSKTSLVLNWSPQINKPTSQKLLGENQIAVSEANIARNEVHIDYDQMKMYYSGSSPIDNNNESKSEITGQYKDLVSKVTRSVQPCGPFTINLGLMQSIRIYFANDKHTDGQLFIATGDAQYKILHFHNGGLNCIVDVLHDWRALSGTNIHHFSVIYPNLTKEEIHPEEGLYCKLTVDSWSLGIDEFGRIQNESKIRKAVFFGGIENILRPVVWPFFLKFYNFKLTGEERIEIQQKKRTQYCSINAERESIFNQETEGSFWRNVACCIEKDVLRTDRANPFFKGDGNPNLDILQRILLNYAVFTKTSYTQGMSDLLSPLLISIQAESNVFWCFVGLMQHTIFISSPSDNEMEKQLFYLRELLRIILPDFYHHLITCDPGAKELLFAHRWILLCFKREFCESDALLIWEACWAHYQCNYFHLFICVAIISLYGSDITEKKLAADEMLLHFSNLASQMNGKLVLKKARGLLHHVRMSNDVPCTLHDLFYVEENDCLLRNMPMFKCAKTPQCLDGCLHESPKSVPHSPQFNVRKLFAS